MMKLSSMSHWFSEYYRSPCCLAFSHSLPCLSNHSHLPEVSGQALQPTHRPLALHRQSDS